MKPTSALVSCLLFCGLPLPVWAQDVSTPDSATATRLAALEKAIEAKRLEAHALGVGLAVIKDDKIIYMKGFGYRDVEAKAPVTPDTLFSIGSCTKAFTALTALISQDDGKLKLSDSPRAYLPYFALQDPDANARITISDLLCHRSGLPRGDLAAYFNKLTSKEVVQNLVNFQPAAKVGETFLYQNEMFVAAGETVAAAQKQSWENFLRQRILDPLDMKQTTISLRQMTANPDHATGYTTAGTPKADYKMPYHDVTCIAPSGAINSNIREMAQWIRFLLNGGEANGKRLVSEAGFQEMVSPHVAVARQVKYSYGWYLRDWKGHKVIEHGGNVDGFTAEVAFMPDQHLGFVLLCNQHLSPLGTDAPEIVWKSLLDTPETATAPPLAVTPSVKPEDEAGDYVLGAFKATVAYKDGRVTFTTAGQPEYTLIPLGGRRYKETGPIPEGFFVTFRQSEKNPAITEIYLEQPQGNVVLTKKAPYHASLTVDELQSKVIAALGGEAALRKHTSQIVREKLTVASQGIWGQSATYAKAPNSQTGEFTLYALKKPLMWDRDWCDGKIAGEESDLVMAQSKPHPAPVNRLIDAEFYEPLNWKTLYKTVVITEEDKIGEEPVYVVVKTPEGGIPRTDYISTKSFLTLKRDAGPYDGVSPIQLQYELFLDYRQVDGVLVPFARIQHFYPTGLEMQAFVEKVEWNPKIADSAFKAKQ